jgi:NADH-quinone oxidoreductase subunit A
VLKLYVPILILFTLAAAFAVVSVFIGPLIGPRRFNKAKSAPVRVGASRRPRRHRAPGCRSSST